MENSHLEYRIHEKEIIHPFLYSIIFLFVGFDAYDLYQIDNFQFQKVLFYFMKYFLIHNVLSIKQCVEIKNKQIIQGIHVGFFGFIYINKRILLHQVKEIKITQNKKSFFEIKAIMNDDKIWVIHSLWNKKDAESSLIKIQKQATKGQLFLS